MICNTSSPGHPSGADEARHWMKRIPCNEWFCFCIHLGLCTYRQLHVHTQLSVVSRADFFVFFPPSGVKNPDGMQD